MAVIQVASREFRDRQASMFALADNGEQVVIRRRGKVSYMLTSVYENDFVLSPEIEGRLEEGRRQYREGQCFHLLYKRGIEQLFGIMMSLYKIEFSQIATKAISKYKKSNSVQYKKLVKLLDELMER